MKISEVFCLGIVEKYPPTHPLQCTVCVAAEAHSVCIYHAQGVLIKESCWSSKHCGMSVLCEQRGLQGGHSITLVCPVFRAQPGLNYRGHWGTANCWLGLEASAAMWLPRDELTRNLIVRSNQYAAAFLSCTRFLVIQIFVWLSLLKMIRKERVRNINEASYCSRPCCV